MLEPRLVELVKCSFTCKRARLLVSLRVCVKCATLCVIGAAMARVGVVLVVLVVLCGSCWSVNPGFRTALTSKGLDYSKWA